MNNRFTKLVALLTLAALTACSDGNIPKSKKSLFLKIIDQVQTGAIKEDASNVIRLPPDMKEASIDGELFISRPSTNEQLIVVFKTWQGKGNNMEGFLYAAMPLTNNEIKKDYYGQPVVSVNSIDLTLEKKLETGWYKISYRLD